MTDAELQAIKARCDAATQGPWIAYDGDEWWYVEASLSICIELTEDNATFIAAARTDIPALLAEIAQLRFIVTEYREGMHEAKGALNAEKHRADVAEQELERLRQADMPKPKPAQPSKADTSRG